MTASAAVCGSMPSFAQVSVRQAQLPRQVSHEHEGVRLAAGMSGQQRAVRLRHNRMQERGRSDH
jgi:hypothetical protein